MVYIYFISLFKAIKLNFLKSFNKIKLSNSIFLREIGNSI